ncbi:MAG TPA: tRNA (adenosine(37)-N6)-dimethylallyltransferase MiaA [Acidimicrobiales bacterium]|nr:tRNA (adenosine(37)-N6)-dimethylallyltransferase MiaA [Acidimicrobiales bacterium]
MARHLVLVGPTASGKSALATALAHSRPGIELVSVDSMQVYRGMDIGTAKPSAAERAAVPHHLIDIASPAERFTVARFADEARAAIAGIEARGATAVCVGGTGLYVQALLGDLSPPGEFPDVRENLTARAADDLYAELVRRDPVAAARMEPGNRRRIVRALEVTIGSGRPFSSFGPGVGAYAPSERFRQVGVWLPRSVVAARIADRLAAMVSCGLVDEVRVLAPVMGPTARQALGYKEVLAHVGEGAPLGDCVAAAERRTREFARRQRAWFRRDPRVRWHGTASDPMRLLPGLLVELDRCLAQPIREG